MSRWPAKELRRVALLLGGVSALGLVFLIARPALVDLDSYERGETSGVVTTSTASGRLLLRVTDPQGEQRRFACDPRGRSGQCLMPAIRMGLEDGQQATIVFLQIAAVDPWADPILLQIVVDGRDLLDCRERLRDLNLLQSERAGELCPGVSRGGA